MKPFVIVSDATCDLSREMREQYDIRVVPGHLIGKDGTDHVATPAWDFLSHEAFYAEIKKDPAAYTTSPANATEYFNAFEGFAKEGCDILCVCISTGISGTFGFACAAKERMAAEYPDTDVRVIDSLRFGPAVGLMCVYAARMRDEGKTISDVCAFLEDNKNRFHQMGWLDDLSFCARKGRLTNAKAFFGTLVGIKPMGEFDYNGLTTVIGKAKGEKNAYRVILDYVAATGEDLGEQTVFIAQTNRLRQAEAFRDMLAERFHPKEIVICDVFAFNGVNVGPGLMAAYYLGKPISKDLSEEKQLMEKLLAE